MVTLTLKNKKAVELTINTIILLTIGLLILIILALLFTGVLGNWSKGSDCQESHGGECKTACLSGETITPWNCGTQGTKCCVPTSKLLGG